MQAIKGGWSGQTFALASDSGGKKSRIRRSKEDRKAMVELFIKRYQSSNDGNFPSLNLTHKEVGGSFYTVREIVREVIQENRVLGPAKLITEEQNDFEFLDPYIITDVHQNKTENHDLDSELTLSMPIEDESISVQQVIVGPTSQNLNDEETIISAVENVELKSSENGSVMTQNTVDFVAETFPLTPVHVFDEKSDTMEEKLIEKDGFAPPENGSVLVFEKVQGTQEVLSVESDEEALVTPEHSEIKDLDKAKSENALENINGSVNLKQPISLENNLNKNSFKKGTSPTLNRINLETWEGSSKKPVNAETNHLLGFIKSVVNAFVKFWTE